VYLYKNDAANSDKYGFTVRLDTSENFWRTALSDNTATAGWHHVAGTYDGRNSQNLCGWSITKFPIKYFKEFSTEILTVMCESAKWPTSILEIDGLIDDVRVYDRALTSDEIASLANGNQHIHAAKYTLQDNFRRQWRPERW